MSIVLLHSNLQNEVPNGLIQWLPHDDRRTYSENIILSHLQELAKAGDRLAWKATDEGEIFHAPIRFNLEQAGFRNYQSHDDPFIKTIESHIFEGLWISLNANQNDVKERAVINLLSDMVLLERRVKQLRTKMPRAYKLARASLTARNLWLNQNEEYTHNNEESE
jgi:hypothetical protein